MSKTYNFFFFNGICTVYNLNINGQNCDDVSFWLLETVEKGKIEVEQIQSIILIFWSV